MPSPTNAQLGAAIREVRKQRGASIENLAADAGVDAKTLGAIERGRANPTWNVIGQIADQLDIEISELVRLAGEVGARP